MYYMIPSQKATSLSFSDKHKERKTSFRAKNVIQILNTCLVFSKRNAV